jgi:hypothetical protein
MHHPRAAVHRRPGSTRVAHNGRTRVSLPAGHAAGILVNAPDKAGVYLLVEPLEAGRWRPFFVDRHSNLSSHLELFARTKELGRVRGYFCALVDAVMPGAEVVRDRSVKFIAEACGVEDPIDPELPLLAVTLPLGLERRRSCSG